MIWKRPHQTIGSCSCKPWKREDAADLDESLSNPRVQANLRSNAVKDGKVLDMVMYSRIKGYENSDIDTVED